VLFKNLFGRKNPPDPRPRCAHVITLVVHSAMWLFRSGKIIVWMQKILSERVRTDVVQRTAPCWLLILDARAQTAFFKVFRRRNGQGSVIDEIPRLTC